MFKYKPQLLFHHTARFPWDPLFLNLSLPSLQCQECPRSNLSGMCPVCTDVDDPCPPPSIPRSKGLSANHPKGMDPNGMNLRFIRHIKRPLFLQQPARQAKAVAAASKLSKNFCVAPLRAGFTMTNRSSRNN